MASSPLLNNGERLGSGAGEPLAAKVAAFASLTAEFPQLLNNAGRALLAAVRDGRLSEWAAAARAANGVAAPETPSPLALPAHTAAAGCVFARGMRGRQAGG